MATVTPKVAIIYYSSTGTIHALAQEYAKGLENAGAEVRIRKVHELAPPEAIASNEAWQKHAEETQDVPEATADDVLWADAVVFGSPTRYGNVTAQLKQFIDTLGPQWAQGQLADKVYSGFTSTSTPHGGQESTLLALYNTFHHFGGITVTPGYTDPIQFTTGNPYGPSHVDGQGSIPISDDTRQATQYAGQRIATITRQLVAGRAEVAAI
ncbi:MAG: NAD(P)H:quinone oxidoreductase, type [Actinomycetospora sp.]|nr:NAD(P)H:quinone oxidoreductase, type [Actinomycetospora sp.]